MRILMLLPNDSMGGAEQYLKMIGNYFGEHKIDLFFLCKKKNSLWCDMSPTTTYHYLNTSNKYFAAGKFIFEVALLNNKKYDYIFTSHVYTTGLVGILIRSGLLKKKYFVARESTPIFVRFNGFKLKTYELFYWLGYKSTDLLICQTEFMKQQLTKGFPRLESLTKIRTIPNPIDFDEIKKQMEKPFIKELPKKYLVSAGRLIPLKGFDNLIRIFSEIKLDHPDLFLIILGTGAELENLMALVKKLNLDNYVILPGFVTNVYHYFKNASACVISSKVEGFPNVLLQMMSQNDKIISTLCAGGIENIPGIFTCEPNNNQVLKKTIQRALKSNVDNKERFQDYLNQISIGSFVNKIKTYLKESTEKDIHIKI